MNSNEQLFRSYLDQMQALNEFVLSYHISHKFSGLKTSYSNEDPDVLRLLESLAFFSARTHNKALTNVKSYRDRLYQQLFPYFLTELPSCGVLRGVTTGLLLEPSFLERGTEFVLRADNDAEYFFQTRADLTLFPIRLSSVSTELSETSGLKLHMRFNAIHTLYTAPDPLTLFLDYIGDTQASFRILGFFKEHLRGVKIAYSESTRADIPSSTHWLSVEHPSYGPLPLTLEQNDDLHPIENERLYFNDPRDELFIHVKLPQPELGCNSFIIEFEFSESWPRGLVVNKDIFQINCVPIINIRRSQATPITSDGTLSKFPILPSTEDESFTFLKAIGVYQINDEGLVPITPGIISSLHCCYEIDAQSIWVNGRPYSYLLLHYPKAFEDPVVVCVDALWYQSNYPSDRDRPCRFILYSRTLSGVTWDWAVLPSIETSTDAQHDKSEQMLNILQIVHKQFYSLNDIQTILDIIGCTQSNFFKDLCRSLTEVRHEFRSVHGTKVTAGYIIYFLTFESELIDQNIEYVNVFLLHIEKVLNQFSTQRQVLVSLDDRKANV